MHYYKGMENVCDICGGTGQIGIFRGLSRFIMTYEEFPECYGTGINQNGRPPQGTNSTDKPSPSSPNDNTNNSPG